MPFSFLSIYICHDEIKDKAFELEMSWVTEATQGRHEWVPKDLFDEAEKYAKEAVKPPADEDAEIQADPSPAPAPAP